VEHYFTDELWKDEDPPVARDQGIGATQEDKDTPIGTTEV